MKLTKEQEAAYRSAYDIEKLGEYELVIGLGIDLFERWKPNELVQKGYLDEINQVETDTSLKRRMKNELFEGKKGNRNVLYLSTQYTAARASSLWEPYFCHGPTNRAIGIGWCGALQREINIGSLILPEQAIPGEGVTAYYFPKDSELPPQVKRGYTSRPSDEMMKSFIHHLQRFSLSPLVGKNYSIESFTCENQELVEKLNQNGYLSIDEETSAFLASGEFHRKPAIVILAVTDNPYKRFHNFVFPRTEIPNYFFDRIKHTIMATTSFLTSS